MGWSYNFIAFVQLWIDFIIKLEKLKLLHITVQP